MDEEVTYVAVALTNGIVEEDNTVSAGFATRVEAEAWAQAIVGDAHDEPATWTQVGNVRVFHTPAGPTKAWVFPESIRELAAD